MKYLLLLVAFLTLFSSTKGVEWEQIKADVTGNIRTIYREGDTILLGDVGIVKSTDGGKTFKPINHVTHLNSELDLADEDMRVMQITKASSGLMMARMDFLPLIFSMDNGDSWNASFLMNDLTEHNLLYIDGLHYLIRDELFKQKNALYVTSDNGETWENDYFNVEDSSKISCITKSPTEEKLLFLYTENENKKYIVKYDMKTKNADKINVDNRTQDFAVLGQSWLIYLADTFMIYESNDEGSNWETLGNIRDTLIMYPEFNHILNVAKSEIETGTNGAFIKYEFVYTTNDTKKHIGVLYSDDKGQSWTPVDFEGRDLNKFNIKVVDNTLFLLPSRAAELNKETNKFENLTYPYSTLHQYKETEDMKMLVTNSDYEPLWINDAGWKNIEHVDQAWITDNSSYYARTGANLNYVKDAESSVVKSGILYMSGAFSNNQTFVCRIHPKSEIFTRVFSKNGTKLLDLDSTYHLASVKNDSIVYALKEVSYSDFELVKKNYISDTEENLDKKYYGFNLYSLFFNTSENSLIIGYDNEYDISHDEGQTWEHVMLSDTVLGRKFKVFKNKVFFQHDRAILYSPDGETWENILEGTSQALIYSFEFDMDNRILVYTSNGAFRSKEPVSVEENTQYLANIDINIYPNPTSDIIKIESAESISNVELYNLSGELLSKQNGLTIDATDLANGTYFIKMQVGEKSIYKQFVVER